jgi:hypothetical protein
MRIEIIKTEDSFKTLQDEVNSWLKTEMYSKIVDIKFIVNSNWSTSYAIIIYEEGE